MTAVETASATMGTAAACDALGVSRAGVYRRRQPARSPAPRPTPPRALDPFERQRVLETLDSVRFLDQAPAQVHATLLDEGTYLCSPRTMYRVLDRARNLLVAASTAPTGWNGTCRRAASCAATQAG